MHIIRNKTIYISISVVLVILSFVSLATFGLSLGIDFTGGTALELRYAETRPRPQVVAELLSAEGFTNTVVQPVGDENITIKVRELTAVEQQKVIDIAQANGLYPAELVGKSMIGPSVGDELKKRRSSPSSSSFLLSFASLHTHFEKFQNQFLHGSMVW